MLIDAKAHSNWSMYINRKLIQMYIMTHYVGGYAHTYIHNMHKCSLYCCSIGSTYLMVLCKCM